MHICKDTELHLSHFHLSPRPSHHYRLLPEPPKWSSHFLSGLVTIKFHLVAEVWDYIPFPWSSHQFPNEIKRKLSLLIPWSVTLAQASSSPGAGARTPHVSRTLTSFPPQTFSEADACTLSAVPRSSHPHPPHPLSFDLSISSDRPFMEIQPLDHPHYSLSQ